MRVTPGAAFRAAAALAGTLYYLREMVAMAGHVAAGRYQALPLAIFYTFIFVLFLIRVPAKAVSERWPHWIIAVSVTLMPLLTKPAPEANAALFRIAMPLLFVGMSVSLVALINLGRSFGVIAALRKVKTGGLYRVVRHPLYAGESLWYFSAVLMNPLPFNFVIFFTHLSLQIVRLLEEEAVLSGDPGYREYKQRVRYRLVPGVF